MPQGFGISQPFDLHEECHGIAALAAGEVLEDLVVGRNREARGALSLERREAPEVGAALLERHVVLHHLHDVHGLKDSLDDFGGNAHAGLPAASSTRDTQDATSAWKL